MADEPANPAQATDRGRGPSRSRRSSRARGTTRSTSSSAPSQSSDRRSRQRQYTFVDNSVDRATSNEAVRVHVMRETHRARREAHSAPQPDVPLGEITILDTEASSITTAKGPSATREVEATLPPRATPEILQSSEATALIDYYEQFTPYFAIDLLPLYKSDTVALNALLAFLAERRIETMPEATDNVNSALYEARALEGLRTRIADPSDGHDDATTLAVATLAMLEQERGNETAARVHWNAVRQMVSNRGGIAALSANRPLQSAMGRWNIDD